MTAQPPPPLSSRGSQSARHREAVSTGHLSAPAQPARVVRTHPASVAAAEQVLDGGAGPQHAQQRRRR